MHADEFKSTSIFTHTRTHTIHKKEANKIIIYFFQISSFLKQYWQHPMVFSFSARPNTITSYMAGITLSLSLKCYPLSFYFSTPFPWLTRKIIWCYNKYLWRVCWFKIYFCIKLLVTIFQFFGCTHNFGRVILKHRFLSEQLKLLSSFSLI